MPNTYTLIASSTVGSGGASSIDFTSIPSTYTDLVLFGSARNNTGANADWIAATFNGSTSSFSARLLQGDGSSASSTTLARLIGASSYSTNVFSNFQAYIPNYSGSSYKSYSSDYVTEFNGTLAYAVLVAGLWSNTAAISSISLTCGNGANSFTQYSSFYLYGIKNS